MSIFKIVWSISMVLFIGNAYSAQCSMTMNNKVKRNKPFHITLDEMRDILNKGVPELIKNTQLSEYSVEVNIGVNGGFFRVWIQQPLKDKSTKYEVEELLTNLDWQARILDGVKIHSVEMYTFFVDHDTLKSKESYYMTESEEQPVSNQKPKLHELVEIYSYVEIEPSFPGGIEEMYKIINQNLKLPKKGKLEDNVGTVWVQFLVLENGSVDKVWARATVSRKCDKEAVRLVKKLPDWNPGMYKGRAVKIICSVPVNFHL